MKTEDKIHKILLDVEPYLATAKESIRKYSKSNDRYDMHLFEDVKRELIDCLVEVSEAQGVLKFYHTVYEQGRKSKKSDVMKELIENNVKVTAADKTVYSDKDYKDYMTVFQSVEQAFQIVNSKYYMINTALSAVQQSIAVARNIENK